MGSELKRCPFCGSKLGIREFVGYHDAYCTNNDCIFRIGYIYHYEKTADEFREWLNTRAPEWQDVKGWEQHYEINNSGVIRKKACKTVLRQWLSKGTYRLVRLSSPRKVESVHRLVALSWLDKPIDKNVVNHKDFNTENNHVTNLEWVTQAENVKHSKKAGRYPEKNYWYGKTGPNTKLDFETAELIRKERKELGTSYRKLAEKYGSNHKSISAICNYKSYLPTPPQEGE